MTDYPTLVIGFLFGLSTGIATTYLGHYWSTRRTKKEEFSPYLTKLYGIVSRIMESAGAENLKTAHSRMIDAIVNEKMRELAIKELSEREATQVPPVPIWRNPIFSASTPFIISSSDMLTIIKECRKFELVHAEMEEKGLIQAMKLRDERLCGYLNMFHQSAKHVSHETSDIVDRLEKLERTSEPLAADEFEAVFQGEWLERLLQLSTHSLFHYGSELKKRLEKHV